MAENGFIIVADITGYTAYLSDSELEHAQEILESLLNTILKEIYPPLTISRTEGDAIISYSQDGAFIMGQTMLEMLEQIYCAFQTELEHSDRNTSCPCNACENMHELDLKFVTHYGEFGLQKLGTMTELVGSDVNLTHRLLKNHISEKTGINAYAYFSKPAIDALKLKEMTSLMKPHSESYEHLGEIEGWVYDLEPVWQRNRERMRDFVGPDEADMTFEVDLPVSPAIAWEYLTEPEHRAGYRFSSGLDTSGSKNGRMDVGVTYHCVHGDTLIPQTISDWRPFDYMTIISIESLGPTEMYQKETVSIHPIPEGSKVTMRFTKMYNAKMLSNLFVLIGYQLRVKRKMENHVPNVLAELKKNIEEDRQSGRLKMVEISAAAASA